MKKVVFFVFIIFQCFTGFSKNSSETDFWRYLSNTIQEKTLERIHVDLIELSAKEEYQSTIIEFLDAAIQDKLFDSNFLNDFFSNMIKDEFLPIFINNNIDFQFAAIEIVFSPEESIPIEHEDSIFENRFKKAKLRTKNKAFKFYQYVQKNNSLPQNMFQHFDCHFYVLKDEKKWLHITYKINSEIEIFDQTIITLNQPH